MTNTERKIYELLLDGMPHSKKEIREKCCEDEMSSLANVRTHISRIRKKIPTGVLIVNEMTNVSCLKYRMVRKLNNPYTGRN